MQKLSRFAQAIFPRPPAAEPSLHDLREWLERARQFRRRVQELRAIAETITDSDTKSGVLAAAEHYARFAARGSDTFGQ